MRRALVGYALPAECFESEVWRILNTDRSIRCSKSETLLINHQLVASPVHPVE